MVGFLTKMFETQAQKRDRLQKEQNEAFLEMVKNCKHDDVSRALTYYNNYPPDDDTKGHALLAAAKNNDVQMLGILTKDGKANVDFNKGCFYSSATRQDGGTYWIEHPGVTPLIMAASFGAYAVVEALLDLKANIDATMQDGRSALMLAAQNGKTDTTRILLYAGADIHFRNSQNQRALEISKANGHFEVERLIQAAHDKKPLPQVLQRVTVEEQLQQSAAQLPPIPIEPTPPKDRGISL